VAFKHGFDGLIGLAVVSDWGTTHELWKDPRIPMWEVTGSEAMGKALLSHIYPTFKRYLLELGGNNAIIIHKDANIKNAVESTLFGAAGTAGQRCTTTRSIFIHRDVFDQFSTLLVNAYRSQIHIGDPFSKGVNIGPVFHEKQVNTFEVALEHFKRCGSELLVGGRVIKDNFVEPTLMKAPRLHYDAIIEEYFVPIAHLVPYEDGQLDEVISEINRSGYGLSGGVFTASDAVFRQCVENVRVGILNMNYGSSGAEAGENFGGEGRTGNSRQLGPGMFRHYTRYINSMISPANSEVVHAQGVSVKIDESD